MLIHMIENSAALEKALEFLNQPSILLIQMIRAFDLIDKAMSFAVVIQKAERVKCRM